MADEPSVDEDIRRRPVGKWEKIGYWVMILPSVPLLPLNDGLASLGLALWERIGVALLVFGTGAYFLYRRVWRERQERKALDAASGVFDCGIRFPKARPNSLSDIWEFGAGRLQPDTLNTLHFQTQVGDLEVTPGGRLKTFANASIADEPEGNAPGKLAFAQRTWQSVFLQTDGGLLQVVAPPLGIAVLERELRAAEPPVPEKRD